MGACILHTHEFHGEGSPDRWNAFSATAAEPRRLAREELVAARQSGSAAEPRRYPRVQENASRFVVSFDCIMRSVAVEIGSWIGARRVALTKRWHFSPALERNAAALQRGFTHA